MPEDADARITSSDIEIKPVYTEADVVDFDLPSRLGPPGEFPFTRGVQPTMYRGRLWTMRQYAGFGTAEETNERFRFGLDHGQTGLSVAFDLPTQMGYDSDDPMAQGEVGKVGVAIDTLDDMKTLFAGIPMERRHDLDDDQRAGGHDAAAVRARGGGAGHRPAQARRDDPERRPQGVHRARDVHLPAASPRCG